MTRDSPEALANRRGKDRRAPAGACGAGGIALCVMALLAGCARIPSRRTVLARQCMAIGGPKQTVRLALDAPAAGLLSVAVRERGISVVAAIEEGREAARTSASPIDRLGTITLVATVARGQSVPVRIDSIDSRDIAASVCVSARLLDTGSIRARAAKRLAAADAATRRRDWQSAFDDYLRAARLFDHLRLGSEAAAARHAMAELAYGYLQRARDSVALLGATLGAGAEREPAIFGTRLVLLAKAILGLADDDAARDHRARELLERATRSFRATPLGRRELPRLTIIEGFLEYREGHPNQAERLFDVAAAGCKMLGDWECFAQARQNFAVLAEQQQNYPAALNAFEQALSSLDAARMPLLAADISSNQARLEGRIGLFRGSAEAQERAMRLYAELGQCDRVRRSASSLGEMLVEVGSVDSAVGYLDQAAAFDCPRLLAASRGRDARGAPFAADDTTLSMADLRSEFGADWPKRSPGPASICERPTAAGSTQIDRVAIFEALLDLSGVAKDDDRFDAARACLLAARRYSVDDRTRVRLIDASGELELARSRPRAAKRHFDAALRLARQNALAQGSDYEGTTDIDLAEAALALNDPADARRRADEALALSSSRADVTQVVAALRWLALSDAASGDTPLAIRTLRTAIGLIEQVPTGELDAAQRATYLATQYSIFGDLTDLLVDTSDTSGERAWRAFAAAEEGHARSLRYAMAQAARYGSAAPPQGGTVDYRALLRTVAESAESGSASARGALMSDLARAALPRADATPPLDRRALAAQLRRLHATLVEYVVGHDDMLAFVTDGTTMRVTRLGRIAPIATAAAALSRQLQAPEPVPSEIRASARDLARLILWPIRSRLTGQSVIFVPDGTLFRVPFDVLPWTGSNSSPPLLQRMEVSEEPSALLLTRQAAHERRPSGSERFVLIGDPVLRDNIWYGTCDGEHALGPNMQIPGAIRTAFKWSELLPSLPGTRREVLGISRIIHGSRPSATVRALLGCSATATALRAEAPRADVLHIATHGLVDARRPRLSALALTPDPPSANDAAFPLLDILRLPLRARLVVLSACDTSRGRILPGEGVLGLAQAFLQAGAETVVASYWRVQDRTTVQFMESFYRHLLVDRLPVAEALRQTQLELAARSGNYDWAAFGVYGRPDSRP